MSDSVASAPALAIARLRRVLTLGPLLVAILVDSSVTDDTGVDCESPVRVRRMPLSLGG